MKPVKGHGIVAIFKIYAKGHHGLFYTVRVFRTKKLMHKFCRKYCSHYKGARNGLATCHSFELFEIIPGKRRRLLPEIGDIHFTIRKSAPSIVVHECVHAGLFWLRRIRKKDVLQIGGEYEGGNVSGDEEFLCHVISNLVRQCNVKLYETGIWRERKVF